MMDDEYFMGLALERAKSAYASGRRPIHCLIVEPDGRVVGEAGNTVARDNDPSAHAEVNAIRRACANLQTLDLTGCSLYTPMEPCPMCLSTILEARISRLVVGARHRRVGRTDLGDYSVESFLATLSKRIEIASVREAECEELRIAWKRSRGEMRR